jgi:hypothetical protein
MACRKQVHKLTYPNGKIYVGMELTRSLLYVGGPRSTWRGTHSVKLSVVSAINLRSAGLSICRPPSWGGHPES